MVGFPRVRRKILTAVPVALDPEMLPALSH